MKYLYLILILIPTIGSSQRSIIELLILFSSSNRADFIKDDHTVFTYTLLFDDEQKADTTIKVNDENINFSLSSIKKHNWKDNVLTTESTSPAFKTSTKQVFEFNDQGKIIMLEIKDPFDDKSPTNEKQLFTYDEKSRLKTSRLLKENIAVDYVVYEASFENPESILPTNAKLNMIMEFEIKREPITSGFKYIFETKIPQDLIDMVKEGLGGNPSEEKIMKELGPFGKIQKKYSEIVVMNDKTMKEDVYEEDREIKNKMNLTASFVFDEEFKIIQKKSFIEGEISENIVYEYNDNGKVKSIQNANEDKKLNVFDKDGNIIKEFTAFGYLISKYDTDKLTEIKEYNSDDSLTSIVVYKYKSN